jgi:cytochrome b
MGLGMIKHAQQKSKAQALDAKQISHKIRIWDCPTRLFHWLLVIAFSLAWLTHGDARYLDYHIFSGYLFLSLLSFRLIWGIWGSHYARFKQWTFGPKAVWLYLKTLWTRQPQHFLGHNPAGSWAIWLILTLGLIVSFTGLLTFGGEEQHGPFAGSITIAQGVRLHQWHHLTAWIMLAVISIHLLGVLISSRLHHENLIKSMITGYKITTIDSSISVVPHRLIATILIVIILASSLNYFKGYFTQTDEHPYLPFIGQKLPDNPDWREACGECHLAYHPTLLPARSWQRLFAEQHTHFEEDLDLEPETVTTLTEYALTHAAETHLTEAAFHINQSIPATESPLRITQTRYWITEHQKITENIWQHPDVKFQANCNACHLDAEQGTYEDGAMRLPTSLF